MSGVDPPGTVRWREFYDEAQDRLAAAKLPSPQSDARRIVEQACGAEGAEFFPMLDQLATVRGVARFDRMLARREAGEPLQYVLGRWGFRRLDLLVDRRVLIPRPETEQVTEWALAELARFAAASSGPLAVADLGTGSGAIALSLAAEHPTVQVWATDQSAEALAVARANLAGLGRPAERVRLAKGWWFEALPVELRGKLALVVSNPPYVSAAETLPEEVVAWEPGAALIAGPTGLEAIETLIRSAYEWLSPGAALVLEMAPTQAESACELARRRGYREIETRADLAGRQRALLARKG